MQFAESVCFGWLLCLKLLVWTGFQIGTLDISLVPVSTEDGVFPNLHASVTGIVHEKRDRL